MLRPPCLSRRGGTVCVGRVTYGYDASGNRLTKNAIGYTWDVATALPVVLQDGSNAYVCGPDLISATDGAGVQTYFLYDELGSTTDLTDAAAAR